MLLSAWPLKLESICSEHHLDIQSGFDSSIIEFLHTVVPYWNLVMAVFCSCFVCVHIYFIWSLLLRREVGGKEEEIREGNCRVNLPGLCLLALLGGVYLVEMLTTCPYRQKHMHTQMKSQTSQKPASFQRGFFETKVINLLCCNKMFVLSIPNKEIWCVRSHFSSASLTKKGT